MEDIVQCYRPGLIHILHIPYWNLQAFLLIALCETRKIIPFPRDIAEIGKLRVRVSLVRDTQPPQAPPKAANP